MASALTVVVLSCWLAGQSGVWGRLEIFKPTIWGSPSRVVTLGGSVTIRCEEPSYPKPTITLNTRGVVSLGGTVSIRCEAQHSGMQFVLNKEGRHFPPVDSTSSGADFLVSNVRREDGGIYNCSYRNQSVPFAMSYHSDPLEVVVTDLSFPRPSISLTPTGVTTPGTHVTIQCQGPRQNVSFFLHKAGDLNPPHHTDPAGNGSKFHIPTVGRQHGGNYSCSYRPRSEPFVSSQPSNPVTLVVADDFTTINITRLVLSAGVLLVLGLILTEAYYSRPRGAPLETGSGHT